jgi:hypothetical protein
MQDDVPHDMITPLKMASEALKLLMQILPPALVEAEAE